MRSSISRRAFLQHSAFGLAAAGALGSWNTSAAAPAGAKLKLSCVDTGLKQTGTDDIWSAVKAIKADGVEAWVDDNLGLPRLFHPERKYAIGTADDRKALQADLEKAGVKITAFCLSNQLDVRPDFEVPWMIKIAEAAKALGIKAVRIDVVSRKLPPDQLLPLAIDSMKKVLAATESTGVCFGVENHGKTTNDPEFLDKLFAGVGSPRLGLTLDTGNFYWFGHPLSKVYELCAKYAARVFHTHCKSIKYAADIRETQRKMGLDYGKCNCPLYDGDIDYSRVVKILRNAGYANDLCIEDESLGKFPAAERKDVLAREIAYLAKCQ